MDHVELKNTISGTSIENSKIIIRNFPKRNIKQKKKKVGGIIGKNMRNTSYTV